MPVRPNEPALAGAVSHAAMRRTGVLVIGGGITGLSAAFELARTGVETTIVEASDRFGGKVQTERADGFLIDRGPDSFVSYRPAATELAAELGMGDALVRPLEPRVVFIRAGGTFTPMPQEMGLVLPRAIRPFLTTPLLSPLDKLRVALDLFMPRTRLAGDVGVGPYLRRRLGRSLVERLAGPLIGGVYGTPVDELSLLAVVPQLRDAEVTHRSLLLASLASRRGRAAGTGSPFITLAGGTGELVGGLVAALRAAPGVDLRTGSPVTGFERSGDHTDVHLASGEVLRPEAIVLAVPGPAAAGMLESTVPAASAALRTIRHGTTGLVTLAYRTDQFPRPPIGHGFLVAGGEPLTIDACTISSNKWPGRAPEGTVLLRAFIGSRSGRSVKLSDEGLIAAVQHDIADTLGVRGAPLLVRLGRWAQLMPQYTVGHLARVTAVETALAEVPGIVVAGAAYRGVGIPDCIAQGRSAARRLLGLLGGSSQERAEPGAPAPMTASATFDQPSATSNRLVQV
jgi:oxygen-dependent protoporphyrinogen oxidase